MSPRMERMGRGHPQPCHSPEAGAMRCTSLSSSWQPFSPPRARLRRALSPEMRKEMGEGSADEETSQVTGLLLLALSNTETQGQDPVPPRGWHILPRAPPSCGSPPFPLVQMNIGTISLLYLFSIQVSLQAIEYTSIFYLSRC